MLVFFVSFGHLRILFFDFVDFGDIDERDMFLPVDFLKLKTLVDGGVADEIDFLFDERELNGRFLWTGLLHYLYNYFQTIALF